MKKVVAIGNNLAPYKEANAYEAITPGMIIDLRTDGQAIKSTTANKVRGNRIALEQDWLGKGIDDAYAANDQVLYQMLDVGMEVNCLVAAAAPAIAVGDFIATVSGGTVAKTATDANAFGIAKEAVDNSGGSTSVRLKVEVR